VNEIRMTATPLEFAYFSVALVGMLVAAFLVRDAHASLAALVALGLNGARSREAWRDVRQGMISMLAFLAFAVIGLAALNAPPPVYQANWRVSLLVGLVLLIVEPVILAFAWANWRANQQSLRDARRESAH
jgi:hypothetical protein